jgi:cysteine-rich repeat protein
VVTKAQAAFDKADSKGGCAVDANAFDLNNDTIGDGMFLSIQHQIDNGFFLGTTVLYKGIIGPTISGNNKGIVPSTEPNPIPPAALSKCLNKQLGALGKYAAALYKCEAKAVKKNTATDPTCIDKANTKINAKFTKAEVAGNDCQVTGEANDLSSALFTAFSKIAPNMPRADGCGNNLVTSGESCDDGNTDHFDACPSDCTIDPCTPTATPRPVRITVSDANVASVLIELDYPEGKISLPGTGDTANVDNLSGAANFDYLDFDHAFRLNASDAAAFGTTDVARLNFVDCSSGGPPVVGDFTCTVKSASGAGGGSIPLPTCTVAIP